MPSTCEQKKTVPNGPDRTATGQQRLAKTHAGFWRGRLKQRSYVRDGKTHLIPEWQIRLFHGGKETWFNLGTPNRDAAAVKARDIAAFLRVNGLDATVAKFKTPEGTPRGTLTVGEYLAAVHATGELRPSTLLNYQNCFQTIIAESFGIKSGRSRYDYRAGGNAEWLKKIHAVRLERLTPERVERWRTVRLKAAGHSPVAMASAKRTINSYVRCAKSLFSVKRKETKPSLLELARKQLKGALFPSPLPFDGVNMFEAGSMKYTSRINAGALVAAARHELAPSNPEAFKLVVLGLMAGLRRKEIDLLEWSHIDLPKSEINLRETEWLHLKTEGSADVVKLDAEVVALLRQWMRSASGPFVVNSSRRHRNDSPRTYLRCKPVFDALNAWLRAKGVKANKPLHELRKEVGSVIANRDGIYAASAFLRHGDIGITARHYADAAKKSSGLGSLLSAAEFFPDKSASA